jgi:E1A/CREB-binding protein
LLVSAVCNYLKNPVYLAGCRAFGIIEKLFTGPIWRIIEASNHILDLNEEWFNFKQTVEKMSSDASALVDGKIIYPEFTNKRSCI